MRCVDSFFRSISISLLCVLCVKISTVGQLQQQPTRRRPK